MQEKEMCIWCRVWQISEKDCFWSSVTIIMCNTCLPHLLSCVHKGSDRLSVTVIWRQRDEACHQQMWCSMHAMPHVWVYLAGCIKALIAFPLQSYDCSVMKQVTSKCYIACYATCLGTDRQKVIVGKCCQQQRNLSIGSILMTLSELGLET